MDVRQSGDASQGVPTGTAILDVDGVIVEHDPAFARSIGLASTATLVGRDCATLWCEESLPGYCRLLSVVRDDPGSLGYCTVISELGGSRRDVHLRGCQSISEQTRDRIRLEAEPPCQFDIDAINGVFALGFAHQQECAMIVASGPTLEQSRILAANVMAADSLGCGVSDVTGQSPRVLAPPELSAETWAAAEQAFRDGVRFDTTYVRRERDGHYRVIEWQFWPLHVHDGRVTHWADRRRPYIEKTDPIDAIRDSNRFLTEALSASDVGIWQWDLAGGDIRFSQRLLQTLGHDQAAIVDPHAFNVNLIHPDDRANMEASIHQAIETGSTFEYVARLRKIDGGYRWIRVRGRAFGDADGRPTRLIGTESDATDEIILRERLLHAEEISRMGYWVCRWNPPLMEWSPGAYRIHGYDPHSYTPDLDNLSELIHPDDWPILQEAIHRSRDRQMLNRGDQDVIRLRIIRADGEVRHCETTAVADRDEKGTIIGLSGTIQDISDLVDMERRLLHSQKLDVIGQLAGGVAHDFNNLLAVIMGNLEMLSSIDDPDRRAACVQTALMATRRGGELTRNLLSFAGKAVLEPAPLDVNEVIGDTVSMLRRLLPETVRIVTELASDPQSIYADRASLENAVMNLAINARDSMPAGGVLTIRTRRVTLDGPPTEATMEKLAPGSCVAIAVSDTGSGIPDSVLPQIFNPFFTTKDEARGTGLGLSMVLGFAQQSGGGVRVESSAGAGTTFTLFFPEYVRPADRTHRLSDNPDVRPLTGRVLLVEDDPAVSQVLASQVEAFGLDCVIAHDCDEALRCFAEAGPFDLLLTDVVIPGLFRGPALADHLKQLQPELQVILISGYPSDTVNRETASGRGYLQLMKPVSMATLHDTLRGLLTPLISLPS